MKKDIFRSVEDITPRSSGETIKVKLDSKEVEANSPPVLNLRPKVEEVEQEWHYEAEDGNRIRISVDDKVMTAQEEELRAMRAAGFATDTIVKLGDRSKMTEEEIRKLEDENATALDAFRIGDDQVARFKKRQEEEKERREENGKEIKLRMKQFSQAQKKSELTFNNTYFNKNTKWE